MKNNSIYLVLLLLLLAACSKTSEKNYDLLPVKIEERWGYINPNGEYVINPQFKMAYLFNEGLARVKDNGNDKFGFIDTKGIFKISPKYISATDFFDGIAAVTEENQKINLINKEGKIIITLDSIESCNQFSEGFAVVKVNGKFGFIDKDGKIIIRPHYLDCGNFSNGLAYVKVDSSETLFGFIDNKENTVIQPKFTNASEFKNGYARIEQNKLWGYINTKGEIKINPQFDWAADFEDGLAAVKLGEKFGYIDTKGKYVINPQFNSADNFFSDRALIEIDKKYGFINKKGEYIVNPQFDYASRYFDKVAFIKQNDKFGLINFDGKIIVNPQFFEKDNSIWGDFALVYEFSFGNSAYSDFFDSKKIAKIVLANCSTDRFFGNTSLTTASDLIKSDTTLLEGSNYLYKNYLEINNEATITKIKYYFKNDFVSYTPQYRTKSVYGYTFREAIGNSKSTNYNVPLTSLYLKIKLKNKEKTYMLIQEIKDELKNIYSNLQEEINYFSNTTLSNDKFSFYCYDDNYGNIEMTVTYK